MVKVKLDEGVEVIVRWIGSTFWGITIETRKKTKGGIGTLGKDGIFRLNYSAPVSVDCSSYFEDVAKPTQDEVNMAIMMKPYIAEKLKQVYNRAVIVG